MFKDGYKNMQNALKIYEYEFNLIFFDKLSTIFLISGTFSWSLCILEISLVFSSYFLGVLAIFEFIIGFFLNLYVYIKRILFIYNYNLNCNPKFWVK